MDEIFHDLDIPHESDAPLGPLTCYGIGGTARFLARPKGPEQLSLLVRRCHAGNVPVYVLGSGANLLVADTGVPGVVVRLDHPQFKQLAITANVVTVGGGYDLAKLVLKTAKAGLGGLECLAGVPATVGGAVRMNAGGAFGNIGRCVRSVTVCQADGGIHQLDRQVLQFAYRRTNITAPFILSVQFELVLSDPEKLRQRVKEIFGLKKNSQPLAARSAGCVFKNPSPHVGASAGKLIDDAGLKGYRHGGACVSDRHANFIVVDNGAAASDVLAVIEHVEKSVLERAGIQLERELVTWP